MLDDVFNVLEHAKRLEKSGNRIEAATKYYESCYLMRQVLFSMKQDEESEPTRRLLTEQIELYTSKAQALYFDDSSTAPAKNSSTITTNDRNGVKPTTTDARSPLTVEGILPPPKSNPNGQQQQQQPLTTPSSSSSSSSSSFIQSSNLNRITQRANMKLAEAIDFDEKKQTSKALETYMKTAELYLEAIRISESNATTTNSNNNSFWGLKQRPSQQSTSSLINVLKRRLEGVLDRIEQLKHPTSRQILPRTNSKDASSTVVSPSTINVAGSGATNNPSLTSSTISSPVPRLSKDEIEILKHSSKIDSGLFLPWSDDDAQALSTHVQNLLQYGGSSTTSSSTKVYQDPAGHLALSDKQKRKFYTWARPMDIAKIRNSSVRQKPPVMIRSINPYTIRQSYVTDCSFIASLCICSLFEKRFRKRLVTSIIYPQNKDGVPIYNPEGRYMVKLWLNGVARVVIVDDYFPIDKYSNLLCSHTSVPPSLGLEQQTDDKQQFEMWVTLIEKAYMKLCGGYDFPGSNSGIDLFCLTGWIPERIFFPRDPNRVRDFETPADRAWDRIFSAASFGDCLITVSTTRDMTDDEADRLGLVTGHAYAVLQVVETRNGLRLLQLKNPWAEKGFKGKYSSYDVTWKDNQDLATELQYNPRLAAQYDDGIFWIGWDDVLRYFQNIQLSWCPSLFQFRVTTHGFWPRSQGVQNDSFNVGDNPQYTVTFSEKALQKKPTIWVLISRHTNKVDEDDDSYLTIHIVRSGHKKRVYYPHSGNTVVNGAYTNNPHVLVRYDIESEEDRHLSLVLSQHEKKKDLAFTLSCFCTEPFSLGRPPKLLEFSKEIIGRWAKGSTGGPVGSPTYFQQNPCFGITVTTDSTVLQLQCTTTKTIAVNVLMFSVPPGTPLTKYRAVRGKPILDSGNYRHAFVVTEEKTIPAGNYMVVVSTWSGQEGDFTVGLRSSRDMRNSTVIIP